MSAALVGLGSNLGDSRRTLMRAVVALERLPSTRVTARSSVYVTAPVGFTPQPDFLNMAVQLETDLEPPELLEKLLGIERKLGRVRTLRWGPRTLDLDLLLFEDMTIRSPGLTVPHPEMSRRGFVLAPLTEIAPDVKHPETGHTIRQMYEEWRRTTPRSAEAVRREAR